MSVRVRVVVTDMGCVHMHTYGGQRSALNAAVLVLSTLLLHAESFIDLELAR